MKFKVVPHPSKLKWLFNIALWRRKKEEKRGEGGQRHCLVGVFALFVGPYPAYTIVLGVS